MSLKLATTAFHTGGPIPEKYSKGGANISPPLSWSGVPQATKSLVLIVDDPDAPSGVFVHWLLYAIPPSTPGLDERRPATETLPDGSRQGRNGFGELGYGGPKPPSGVHRYFFHLYALDTELHLPPGASREDLDRAMQGHILEQSEIFGTFSHRNPGSQAA
jgi:Raf kinase inhibitor-like YbhB/YbcL family protein